MLQLVLLVLLVSSCAPAALADTLTVTCPASALNVKNGPVNYTCHLLLDAPSGCNAYQVIATLDDYTVNPINGYEYVEDANITHVDLPLIFELEQYSPNGTYSVYAYAVGYASGVSLDYSTSFSVAASINDNLPPTLTKVFAPAVNISKPDEAYVQISAYDDLSKFDQIEVSVSSIKGGFPDFAQAQWISSGDNNAISFVQDGTSVVATLPITFYQDDILPGFYFLQVTLCDIFRHCTTISSDQLQQEGLQYELDVGPSTVRDSLSFECPEGPFDVKDSSIYVNCYLSVQYSSGVQYYQAFASQTVGQDVLRLETSNGDYYNTDKSVVSVTTNVTFLLRQYQPDGKYTVQVQTQGANSAFISGVAYITVARTINDEAAPNVSYVYAPSVTNTTKLIPVTLHASDDLGGVDYIYVSAVYNYQPYADTRWYAPKNTSRSTNLNITLALQSFGPLPVGVYNLQITVTDVYGRSVYYTKDDLQARGLQYNLVVTPAQPSDSPPQLTKLYVPPVVKDRSDLFVRISAKDSDGIVNVIATAYHANTVLGSNSWKVSGNNTQLSVSDLALPIQIPRGAAPGIYFINVTLGDRFSVTSRYSYANITQLGFRVSFTYAPRKKQGLSAWP